MLIYYVYLKRAAVLLNVRVDFGFKVDSQDQASGDRTRNIQQTVGNCYYTVTDI